MSVTTAELKIEWPTNRHLAELRNRKPSSNGPPSRTNQIR